MATSLLCPAANLSLVLMRRRAIRRGGGSGDVDAPFDPDPALLIVGKIMRAVGSAVIHPRQTIADLHSILWDACAMRGMGSDAMRCVRWVRLTERRPAAARGAHRPLLMIGISDGSHCDDVAYPVLVFGLIAGSGFVFLKMTTR